ncbi:alpha/beta fold hydrolase [Desertibaculum subflavum]|uniref:alpha/beta fold hydrolase n=1 Tax=Desertibaculum subflavum TaxID=2268458 RepID=UPI000E66C79E
MTQDYAAPARRLGTLERPDCRIHFEETGEGPALIFAHGLGGNQLSWWQQVGHFSARYRCITFAHRGFAPSSRIEGGPDPARYGDDLAALVDHLKLTEVRIVAQSMGGWSAVEYALKRTGKLKALVLAATTGSLDPAQAGEAVLPRLAAWAKASENARADLVRRSIHVAAGARMAAEQPALHLLYRHIDDMNAHLDKEAIRARLGRNRTRAPAELAKAGCPVLFIAGDEDVVIPPFAGDVIAPLVPGARAAHIPDAGHSAYFERAAAFNRLVEEFLASVA